MQPTHRVLAASKQNELGRVKQHIGNAYGMITRSKADDEDVDSVAREINAWFACQHGLKRAQTWPFSIETLKTPAISMVDAVYLTNTKWSRFGRPQSRARHR